ncbi:CvfB family protein [Bombilactobacillus thymidiniphilus]|uniref:DNA-binding protein n=1 Tax=Bombilactobacillus thymidiniphilus TaxID=2923363 RepID=A0ABY4PDD6_9LACO|nr:S1-like domain-containing RNA-binding protein [Bombilactobacillus thymidiniphilus]UQS83726.1 DNA-binding protein [Bombilactobacillus thymidiniphilus]
MNLTNLLGTVQQGNVIDQNDDYYFVSIAGHTFQVDKKHVLDPKQVISGYLYENKAHNLVLTPDIPNVGIGRYGWGQVVDIRSDLGVFVNIGLADKDLVVSLDDLPEIKSLWPKKGDRLLLAVKLDHKDRMWGQLADANIFQQLSRQPQKTLQNKNVKATVYQLKMNGTFVLTNDYYLGFIHPSEREREPRLGEVVSGRVVGLSFNRVNLSLKPRGYEEISDDAAMILAVLQHQPNKSLNFNDKSQPEDIKRYFGISKSSFKRALGNLLKRNLIVQDKTGIKLIETASD